MLVLSRRTDERIMIGNDIVITVLEIHHDHVRLGIDAPRHIDVHREEVYRLVQAANIAASEGDTDALASLRSVAPPSPAPGAEPGPDERVVARLAKSPSPSRKPARAPSPRAKPTSGKARPIPPPPGSGPPDGAP